MIVSPYNRKRIFFSKMHGLGNDFIVLNCLEHKFDLSHEVIKLWSNRNTGIGFDQLLILEKSHCVKADFNYRIINSDGTEVEQCGNGARCIAYYLKIKKLISKKKICVRTKNRYLFLEVIKGNFIKVNMGVPLFDPISLSCTLKYNGKECYFLEILQKVYPISIVSLGNPHCLIIVNNLKDIPVVYIGKKISQNSVFTKGVNVNFMEIISVHEIFLRVYERGSGETQACGSGACASVVIGIRKKILNSPVTVYLYGGSLKIQWSGKEYDSVYMFGTAEHVYDGIVEYP